MKEARIEGTRHCGGCKSYLGLVVLVVVGLVAFHMDMDAGDGPGRPLEQLCMFMVEI